MQPPKGALKDLSFYEFRKLKKAELAMGPTTSSLEINPRHTYDPTVSGHNILFCIR